MPRFGDPKPNTEGRNDQESNAEVSTADIEKAREEFWSAFEQADFSGTLAEFTGEKLEETFISEKGRGLMRILPTPPTQTHWDYGSDIVIKMALPESADALRRKNPEVFKELVLESRGRIESLKEFQTIKEGIQAKTNGKATLNVFIYPNYDSGPALVFYPATTKTSDDERRHFEGAF